MRTRRWMSRAGLVLCLAAAGCTMDLLGEPGESAGWMRFDLRALEDEPRSASVALASITLAVEQRGRETQEHPKQLGPDSVEVTFPLTVRRGLARFLPEIRTRNGTVVFAGNSVVDVRRNGFVAKVPLVQKVPLTTVPFV